MNLIISLVTLLLALPHLVRHGLDELVYCRKYASAFFLFEVFVLETLCVLWLISLRHTRIDYLIQVLH